MARIRNLKEAEIMVIESIIKKFFPELDSNSSKYIQIKTMFEKYLSGRRDSIYTFEENISTTFNFFSCLGLSNMEIFKVIDRYSSLIHLSNDDILHRLLIVNRLHQKNEKDIVKFTLINRTKDLTTGADTAYARVKYIERNEEEISQKFRGDTPYTLATIFHSSASDFSSRFQSNEIPAPPTEELIMEFPFYSYNQDGKRNILPSVLEELITWPGNIELLDKFYNVEGISKKTK